MQTKKLIGELSCHLSVWCWRGAMCTISSPIFAEYTFIHSSRIHTCIPYSLLSTPSSSIPLNFILSLYIPPSPSSGVLTSMSAGPPSLNGHLEHALPAPTVFSCQSSSVRGRALWPPLLSVLDSWLAWSCIGLVLATIHACNDADSFRRHYFSTFLPNNSHSYNISFPSSAVFPETHTSPFLYDVLAPRTLRYIRTQQS